MKVNIKFISGLKKSIVALTLIHLLLFHTNCSQSIEPLNEETLIAFSQTGAHFSSDGEMVVINRD